MESLNNTLVNDFPPNTLECVRRFHKLDDLGRLDEAIDLLEGWLKKQSRFGSTVISRDYLERCLICSKGSVERAKHSLDSMCAYRALLPFSYADVDVGDLKITTESMSIVLPKFAPDFHRVFMVRCSAKDRCYEVVQDFYKYTISFCEYTKANDYFNGLIAILDYRDLDIVKLVTAINPMDLRIMMSMYIEGYHVRIKGIHILTDSKMVDILVKLLKQVVSPKIRDRLHVHRKVEEVYDVVPKEILPKEYGGEEKSLVELQDDWRKVLSSNQHRAFMRKMSQFVMDQSSRGKTLDEDGITVMPGTFRTLVLD